MARNEGMLDGRATIPDILRVTKQGLMMSEVAQWGGLGAPGLSWPGSQGRRYHLNFLDTLCGVCGAHGWGARATLPFQEVVALKDKESMMDSFFNIEPKFLPAMRAVGELRTSRAMAMDEFQPTIHWEELYNALSLVEAKPLHYFSNMPLNVAVVGEAGSGKSSLVNGMLGKHAGDLNRFDFFIIVGYQHFQTVHADLVPEIQAMGKRFYFVRAKTDLEASRKLPPSDCEDEQLLQRIEEDCMTGLLKESVIDPPSLPDVQRGPPELGLPPPVGEAAERPPQDAQLRRRRGRTAKRGQLTIPDLKFVWTRRKQQQSL
ncbi:UNVERIFIED_CONTAM: hypothetical protein K2H54_025233 [Gekko kuhli]